MMFDNKSNCQIYLACGYTDMRKAIDGLAAIVQLTFNLDLGSDNYFVFCSKDKRKVKILHYDYNGFALYYKRLDYGKLDWPMKAFDNVTTITYEQLEWMLNGSMLIQKQSYKPKIFI